LGTVGVTALIGALMWLGFGAAGWPTGTLARALGWSTLAAAVAALFCHRWFSRRLGGFTGDTLGASQQLSELAILLAWLHVVHPIG